MSFVSMVLALTMALDTMAFQLPPQYTTRMKGRSQHFQIDRDRDDSPERKAVVETNIISITKTLDRIEESIKENGTKIDKVRDRIEEKIDKVSATNKDEFSKLETKIDKVSDRIEESIKENGTKIDKVETKIDKVSATATVIMFFVFGLSIVTGMVNLPQLVALFKGI
jgi:septation ring formation regulator EzrA